MTVPELQVLIQNLEDAIAICPVHQHRMPSRLLEVRLQLLALRLVALRQELPGLN